MTNHPVQFRVDVPEQMNRIHVLIRLVLLMALGTLGGSSVYWLIYLVLPAVAALLLAQKGGERYRAEDAPPFVRGLQWLAGIYAYLWLLTDTVPDAERRDTVELNVEPSGQPSAASALLRLVTSLPALIVLVVLSFVACFLWVIGAIAILLVRRAPTFITDFLAGVLRYQFRLIAYHGSLVDAYPSFEETHLAHPSGSGAA